jgi:hypothetical protein
LLIDIAFQTGESGCQQWWWANRLPSIHWSPMTQAFFIISGPTILSFVQDARANEIKNAGGRSKVSLTFDIIAHSIQNLFA